MRLALIAALLLITFDAISLAQNPTPIQTAPTPLGNTSTNSNISQNRASEITNQTANTAISSPSPSLSLPDSANRDTTTVRISREGIELSGFPTWIIWVLIGVAVVCVIIFFVLRSKDTTSDMPFFVLGVIFLLILGAIVFSVGSWWGRSSARSELQQIIAAQSSSVSQNQSSLSQTPTPLPSSVSDAPVSSPFYANIWGFTLLVGLEALIGMYLFVRLRSLRFRDEYRGNIHHGTRMYQEGMQERILEEQRRQTEYIRLLVESTRKG